MARLNQEAVSSSGIESFSLYLHAGKNWSYLKTQISSKQISFQNSISGTDEM